MNMIALIDICAIKYAIQNVNKVVCEETYLPVMFGRAIKKSSDNMRAK